MLIKKYLTPLRVFWHLSDRTVSPQTCLGPKPKAKIGHKFEGHLKTRRSEVVFTISFIIPHIFKIQYIDRKRYTNLYL